MEIIIYIPVAFVIGDSKNDTSWDWFLLKLYEAISSTLDFFLISDRHNNIKNDIATIFMDVYHDFCITSRQNIE